MPNNVTMKNTKITKFVFNNVLDLAGYVKQQLDNPTPIKVQKALYFLWAFYAATYGNIDYDSQNPSEFNLQAEPYPKFLFAPDFIAQRYGPVIKCVYLACQNQQLKTLSLKDLQSKITLDQLAKNEVILFINNLLEQINSVNDFGLVQRTHQDKAWKVAYAGQQQMSPEMIKADYLKCLA